MYLKENEKRLDRQIMWHKIRSIAFVVLAILIVVFVIYLLTGWVTTAMAQGYSDTQHQVESFNLYLNKANDPTMTYNEHQQRQRVLDRQLEIQHEIDNLREEKANDDFMKIFED